MSRDEFYNLSLREFFREAVIAKRKREDDQDRDVVQAWFIGLRMAQAQAGKLPELKTLLTKRAVESHKQTVEQQRTMLQMISERYNIPLRTRTKPKGTSGRI